MTSPPAPPAPNPIVPLDADECREVLVGQRLCVLATADLEEPYAVPVFYGFDAESATLYAGVSEGRKTRVLDRNPLVCVVVTETAPGDVWRSVMVAGRAEWVSGEAARARAVQVLVEHNRRWREARGEPPPAAPRRHLGTGRMLRVAGATITGRARR